MNKNQILGDTPPCIGCISKFADEGCRHCSFQVCCRKTPFTHNVCIGLRGKFNDGRCTDCDEAQLCSSISNYKEITGPHSRKKKNAATSLATATYSDDELADLMSHCFNEVDNSCAPEKTSLACEATSDAHVRALAPDTPKEVSRVIIEQRSLDTTKQAYGEYHPLISLSASSLPAILDEESAPPGLTPEHPAASASELLDTIKSIKKIVDRNAAAYVGLREEFLAVNRELNRRGITFAPRFRGNPRPSHKAPIEAEKILGRDRQMIDLHWLFSRRARCRIASSQYEDLIEEEEFDFALAEDFASEPWTAEHKSTLLSLPQELQWQLDAIQPKGLADRFRSLLHGERTRSGRIATKGIPQIRAALEDSIANAPQMRGYVDEWVTLWLCSAMVGNKPAAIARLYCLATGTEPMQPSSAARKLKRVLDRLR